MYCDDDIEDSSLEKLGPPRRQVYKLLTDLITVWLSHPCLFMIFFFHVMLKLVHRNSPIGVPPLADSLCEVLDAATSAHYPSRLSYLSVASNRLNVELQKKGLKLRNISTFGHSLGGALAALCAFDLGELLLDVQVSSSCSSHPATCCQACISLCMRPYSILYEIHQHTGLT